MIVDISSCQPLDWHEFPTLPEADSAVIRKYMVGEIEVRFHRMPSLYGSDAMVASAYALTAHHSGNYIFACSIEALDLRALSKKLNESLRSLQSDYNTKLFYAEPHLVLYGNGLKEDLGIYRGVIREDAVIDTMMDALLDSLDAIEEPVEI